MSGAPTPPAGEPTALLPALPDPTHTVSISESLDSLSSIHLPQTQRAMDELFNRMYVLVHSPQYLLTGERGRRD